MGAGPVLLALFVQGVAIESSNPRMMGWDESHGELTENLSCSYSKSVQIDFDPAKDRANYDKHGVSLVLAVELDWEVALVWVDDGSSTTRRA